MEDPDSWTHFGCGLLAGAAFGAFVLGLLVETTLLAVAGTVGIALALGFACGRWGDRAWHALGDLFLGSRSTGPRSRTSTSPSGSSGWRAT